MSNNDVKIVTDSIACIPKRMLQEMDVTVVPSIILVNGKNYRDGVDITADEAYRMFLQNPDEFKTAPAPAGCYIDAYRAVAEKSASIMSITVSSKLSTTYNMARIAAEHVMAEIPGLRIEVLDSGQATASEGFIVLAAARAAAQGEDMTSVIGAAESVKNRVSFYVVLDTLRHVYRTGRVPKQVSQVGAALGIRPVLTVSQGKVEFAGLARNRNLSLDKLISMMHGKINGHRVHVAVMHAYAPEEALRLKERLAAEFDCTELWITEFSPMMGYACGTGTIGAAFYTVEDDVA